MADGPSEPAARRIRDDLPEYLHGRVSTYNNEKCRCDPCRAASTKAHSNWALRAAKRKADIPHATSSGYNNWGCRCEECRIARAVSRGQMPKARKE